MLKNIQQHNQAPARMSSPTLVIVEDDQANREVLEMLFSSETPYRLLVLENGREALKRVGEIIASHPVLFLLDYQLPIMTGLDLYTQLHALPSLEAVPAMILTVYDGPEVVAIITDHGLPFFLKPFAINDLLQAIDCSALPAQGSRAHE
jgi:CheY-like chemotaxis protein